MFFVARGRIWPAFISIFFVFCLSIASAFAQSQDGRRLKTRSTCPVSLPKYIDWTDIEHWAWTDRICLGLMADLNDFVREDRLPSEPQDEQPEDGSATSPQACGHARKLQVDPGNALSAEFVQLILSNPEFSKLLETGKFHVKNAVFKNRIRIEGVKVPAQILVTNSIFEDVLYIQGSEVDRNFMVSNSTFEKGILSFGFSTNGSFMFRDVEVCGNFSFPDARIKGIFALFNSNIHGHLLLDRIHVGKNLVLADGTQIKGPLQAEDSRIEGHLIVRSVEFERQVKIDQSDVGKNIVMRGVTVGGSFSALRLRVDGGIEFNPVTFMGKFDATRLQVGGSLLWKAPTLFDGDVVLRAADVGYQFDAQGINFCRRSEENAEVRCVKLDAESIHVGQHLFLQDTTLGDLLLLNAAVTGSLDLSGANLHGEVTLGSATIGQQLILHSASEKRSLIQWNKRAKLDLRNASANAIQDTADAWNGLEGKLDLAGFSYKRLGGNEAVGDSIGDRSADWLVQWLAKQSHFALRHDPLPFLQLASVLETNGRPALAREIRIAARDHELVSEETPLSTRASLALQRVLILYGYNNWLAVFWIAGLIVLGWVLLRRQTLAGQPSIGACFWYSFDRALPIISLKRAHNDWVLPRGLEVYFYCHHLVGFVLATFLAAGLSGFTK